MRTPELELLWWEGCPSTERVLDELRAALDELGLAGAEVHTREIESEEEALESGFTGSPTILIDGEDAVPPPEGEAPALTCRLYRRRDGRISPTPDPDDLREALRRAMVRQEISR